MDTFDATKVHVNDRERHDKTAPTNEGNELKRLAMEIGDALKRANKASQERLTYYRSAGEGLNKAKELEGHGNWDDWLKENFDLSRRQAEKYMRFAKAPRKALLEEEEAEWRKASGAVKKAKPSEKEEVPDDGSRDFIPTLTREEDEKYSPMIQALMAPSGKKTAKEIVFWLIESKYREGVAPCLKQSA